MLRRCAYVHCNNQLRGNRRQKYCDRNCKEKARRKRAGWPERGRDRHPLYSTWYGMIQRCYYPAAPNYRYYGALGVRVCDRWREADGRGFANFLEDMGEKPAAGLTLDRIDPLGDYEPTNCRWASWTEQRLNRRPGGTQISGPRRALSHRS